MLGSKFDIVSDSAKGGEDKVCGRAPTDIEKDPLAVGLGQDEKSTRGYQNVITHLRDFFANYGKHMDLVGRMSTISSVLKTVFPSKMWFVGYYLV